MATLLDRQGAMDEGAAAAYLGVTKPTLQKWRWAKRGPTFCKVGRLVRYLPKDLDAFLDSCKREMARA